MSFITAFFSSKKENPVARNFEVMSKAIGLLIVSMALLAAWLVGYKTDNVLYGIITFAAGLFLSSSFQMIMSAICETIELLEKIKQNTEKSKNSTEIKLPKL